MTAARIDLIDRSRRCVWRCLYCRCTWDRGKGDWEEAPDKDDDVGSDVFHDMPSGGLQRSASGRALDITRRSGLDANTIGRCREQPSSEDEGFVSAVESDDSPTQRSPRQRSPRHRSSRPKLLEDALEEEVASYEELTMPSVTGATIAEVCRMAGTDPLDLKCRLTARRYAIANGGNVRSAVKQMVAHKAWLAKTREEMVNQYHDDPLLVELGYDNRGHPLYLWDGLQLNAKDRSTEDLVLQLATILQRATDALESGDGLLNQGFRPAWRLQKISLILFLPVGSEPDFRKVGPVLRLFQNQFPERLYRALIFPIGKWTPFFWRMVKPFLDARTVQKIKLLQGGCSPPELLDYVSPEYLPEKFGGALQN